MFFFVHAGMLTRALAVVFAAFRRWRRSGKRRPARLASRVQRHAAPHIAAICALISGIGSSNKRAKTPAARCFIAHSSYRRER